MLRVALRIGDDDARLHIEDAGRNASGVVMGASAANADAASITADANLDAERSSDATPGDAAEVDADPIIVSARRDIDAIGGNLDALRLRSGALRVTARFARAPESDDEATG